MPTARELANLYKEAHNVMRNVDGLQPQEAFDELLKYLYFKQRHELINPNHRKPTVKEVRTNFATYLGRANSWSSAIWRERALYLSDECLGDIHDLFHPVNLWDLPLDVRSHALREFLTPEIRKGLGIYLTPEEVVKTIIQFVDPPDDASVLDPACGSGTFLIEAANNSPSGSKMSLYGIDKNPRMLLLADLNLTDNANVVFHKTLCDSLRNDAFSTQFDFIFTNPPFGVTLDARDYSHFPYTTFQDEDGYQIKKQSSEIVFIERCFQLLKPGGTLAIIIPRSIATNNRLAHARRALSEYGYITAIISLPPETFATTGTQTTTIALIAKTYSSTHDSHETTSVIHANVKNVGFDATGRERPGNELHALAELMHDAAKSGRSETNIRVITMETRADTFPMLDRMLIGAVGSKRGVPLAQLCHYIGTGKTPARSTYSDSGGFLIKVGNLTGSGINWEARERNHISLNEMRKRQSSKKPLTLQKGDILLTSSAHNSTYIARKSDIFCGPPEFIDSTDVSFVGEVMLVRPNLNLVCPYALLAFFRELETIELIQQMVRGQTAHLHSSDLAKIIVPDEVVSRVGKYSEAAKVLEKQATLSQELNSLLAQQRKILDREPTETPL